MSRKNELYKRMLEVSEEVYGKCDWSRYYNTMNEWNELVGENYGAATYTALVSDGLIGRFKHTSCSGIEKGAYYYYVKQPESEVAEYNKNRDIEKYENIIATYDERVASCKEFYEEQMRDIERQLAERLATMKDFYEDAKQKLDELNK